MASPDYNYVMNTTEEKVNQSRRWSSAGWKTAVLLGEKLQCDWNRESALRKLCCQCCVALMVKVSGISICAEVLHLRWIYRYCLHYRKHNNL